MGARLSAQDVLDYVHSRNVQLAAPAPAVQPHEPTPLLASGLSTPLTPSQRAMLKTVLWHRDSAVTGYVELEYDPQPWESYANTFRQKNNLLLNPLLPLMACRLAQIAQDNPKINCTIVGDKWYQYDAVNLGFTLQSESKLALLCIRDAGKLAAEEFVLRLQSLMRQGMKDKLAPEDTAEITLCFSSMARWHVTHHVPVLPPYTSLIVAHASPSRGVAALGATYDHRVLTGGDVAVVLRLLTIPPDTKRR